VLIELEPILEDRNLLGVAIKYGEDRFLTHQIVKHGYRTRMTMDAMCFTKARPPCAATSTSSCAGSDPTSSTSSSASATAGSCIRCLPAVLSMLMLLLIYPFVIATHVANGQFFELAMFHVEVIALFGLIYYFAPSVRRLPPYLRVHPLAFLPMRVLMPSPISCSRRSGCSRSTRRAGRPAVIRRAYSPVSDTASVVVLPASIATSWSATLRMVVGAVRVAHDVDLVRPAGSVTLIGVSPTRLPSIVTLPRGRESCSVPVPACDAAFAAENSITIEPVTSTLRVWLS